MYLKLILYTPSLKDIRTGLDKDGSVLSTVLVPSTPSMTFVSILLDSSIGNFSPKGLDTFTTFAFPFEYLALFGCCLVICKDFISFAASSF